MSLILTRRIGESIKIGNDITILIADVNGNQVKLAIDAPKAVEVHREEIYEKIQLEKQQNKNSPPIQKKSFLKRIPFINPTTPE